MFSIRSTWFLAITFVLLWNSGFIGAEYGLPYADPFTLLFWRYWALSFILLSYLAVRRRLRWPGLRSVLIASGVGILAHGVWLGCVMFSLQYGVPAGIVALVVALQPLTTGALSGLAVGEKTPVFRWIGLLVGFCGVVLVLFSRIKGPDAISGFAYVLPFGSVIGITIASLIERKLNVQSNPYRLPVDISLFYQSLGTALAVSVPALVVEDVATQWDPVFVRSMLWLIVGESLAAYALMWQLITRITATRVASLFYFGPPVTMAMAWIAFGDTLLITDVLGLMVVAVGVFMAQLGKTRRA